MCSYQRKKGMQRMTFCGKNPKGTAKTGGIPSSIRSAARVRQNRTSKTSWACGVVMAKKTGNTTEILLRVSLLLNAVTLEDAYHRPRMDESLSKHGDSRFSPRWIWDLPSCM